MVPTVAARVAARTSLTDDIAAFTLAAVEKPFGLASAGAHIDLHLPGDLVRSYSLTRWDEADRTVEIAVKVEPEGRGGSLTVHRLQVGDEVEVAGPRNNFALTNSDEAVVLLAGGIGVTPIYAMARHLRDAGQPPEVLYSVRTRTMAAFDPALRSLDLGDRYRLTCDDEDGIPDLWRLLEERPADTRYYACGPEPMLNAIEKAVAELGRGTVVTERFAAVAHDGPDAPFDVVLAASGEALHVPADRTILDVLRGAGHDLDYSCGEGTCGTCILDVLDGEIDHRDVVLDEDEKAAQDCLAICVSRAAGSRLVLDL